MSQQGSTDKHYIPANKPRQKGPGPDARPSHDPRFHSRAYPTPLTRAGPSHDQRRAGATGSQPVPTRPDTRDQQSELVKRPTHHQIKQILKLQAFWNMRKGRFKVWWFFMIKFNDLFEVWCWISWQSRSEEILFLRVAASWVRICGTTISLRNFWVDRLLSRRCNLWFVHDIRKLFLITTSRWQFNNVLR